MSFCHVAFIDLKKIRVVGFIAAEGFSKGFINRYRSVSTGQSNGMGIFGFDEVDDCVDPGLLCVESLDFHI